MSPPGRTSLSRRQLWRLRIVVGVIVIAIVGAAMAGWLIARTSSPPSGPVILISIDSLRADRLGSYGYQRARTPNMDALAAAGIVFERAYSHSPLTLPAHVSILSGRLPFETGIRAEEGTIAPKPPLLPALLHRRGFKTAGIVSSDLLARATGLAGAFDFFDDEMPRRAEGTRAGSVYRDGAATIDVAKHWVEQQGTRFFLFLHLDEPRRAHGNPEGPPYEGAPAQASLEDAGDPYDRSITRADQLVGNFLQFLKDRAIYDRAIVVLTSDHGEALGDHGETGHGVLLHDATLRTPLIVKMPKDEEAGRRRLDVVQHLDILPTILDLMGGPRPSGIRGRSFRNLLYSDDATLPAASVYAESSFAKRHYGWSELASLTEGRYRYIRAPRPELYDLVQDRGERENLAQSNPAKVAELSAALDQVLAAVPPPAPSPLTQEDRAVLAGNGLPAGDARPKEEPDAARAAKPPADAVGAPADPKDRLALLASLRAAGILAAQRRYQEAAAAYREVLAKDEGMIDAWRSLGFVLVAAGDPAKALDAYRKALRLQPDDADTILRAADCLARLRKPEDSERYAAVAAKLSPVEGNEALARLALRRRDYPAAQLAADAARQADAGSPVAALAAGMELFEAGKDDEALQRLEEAARLAAARPVQMRDADYYFAQVLSHTRRYSEAEARLIEELRWFPDHLRAREALASVLQETGRSAEVKAVAADLVHWNPTPEGYAAAVRVCASAGDKADAAALRAEGRRLFGEANLRAAELARR